MRVQSYRLAKSIYQMYGNEPYKSIDVYGNVPYACVDGLDRLWSFLMALPARTVRSNRVQTERLEARVAAEQKAFFQRAATLRGVSLTEFMVASMREAAVKTIEEHELVLSAKDQQTLIDVLMNPPEPNAALLAAAENYFRTVSH